MAYGDYDGPNKPDKGKEGGSCNRTRCQCSPASWYNHGSRSWYCDDCRRDIEFDSFNLRDWQANFQPKLGHPMFETRDMMEARENPAPQSNLISRWLPIDQADKTITDVQDFPEVGMTIRTSDRYWVRDDDGRVYEAAWSEGNNGRDYWWDFEGESPVDPVEFMPHPLDPRFASEGKV